MNRRAFLRGLLGTATAAALPVAPKGWALPPFYDDPGILSLGPHPMFGRSVVDVVAEIRGGPSAQTRAILDSFREVSEIVARRAARSLNERWGKPGDNPLGSRTSPDGGRASGEAA